MKNILSRLVFLLLVVSLFTFNACSRANEQLEGKNDPAAADFTLQTVDADKIVLSNILQQRKAVLVFWTTWCGYCRIEAPKVEKFYLANKEQVAVIGINLRESRAKAEQFAQKMNLSYPIALDPDGKVAKLYNVRGVPTIIAIEQNGKISYYGHSIEEMTEKVTF